MDVIVIGASGYSGLELIRILIQHPKVEILHMYANSNEYGSILEIYPHLQKNLDLPVGKLTDLTETTIEELKQKTDVVFFATPSGVSKDWGAVFYKHGFRVIDLSGDYRLKDLALYPEWYTFDHPYGAIVEQAVYGLSEWFSEEIKKARYIANPGCYATSILLALAPIFKQGLSFGSIVIDAKSGVSGAGKGFSNNSLYAEVNENFKAYKVGRHQHIPEIEQTLALIGEVRTTIQMVTHLVPMTRGILATIYVPLTNKMTYQEIKQMYEHYYAKEIFIRLKPEGFWPETKQVLGTNYCDIGFYLDNRTNNLIIFSALDNLMKGAAGQAVQNFNLMMGWDEGTGLSFIPLFP